MGDLERIGSTFCSISAIFHSSETLLMTHWSLSSPRNVWREKCTEEQDVSYPGYLLLFNSPIPPLSQTGKWLPYKFKTAKIFLSGNTWIYDYLKVICIYPLCAKLLGWVKNSKCLSVRHADRKHLGLEPPATTLDCLWAMETPISADDRCWGKLLTRILWGKDESFI